MAHSNVVGGSSAERVLNCPGSIDLCKNMPGEEWKESAAKGTACHWVVEECLNSAKVPRAFLGETYAQITLDEDLIENKVIPAHNYYFHIKKKYQTGTEGSWIRYVEKEVGFQDLDEDDIWYIAGAFGTADIIFDNGIDRCGIIDWKFGEFPVSAANNYQMMFYLAGAIACGYLPEVDVYEAHIFQPAYGKDPSEWASVAEYTYEELDNFICDLAEAVRGIRNFNPGKWCRFCKAAPNCTALSQMVVSATYSDLENVTAEDFARYLSMATAITNWVDSMKKAAVRNARKGLRIPGYRLEAGLSNRYVKQEDKAKKKLKSFGLKDSQITNTKLISITEMDALLKRLVKSGDITQVQMNEFYNDHVDRDDLPETLKPCAEGDEGYEDMSDIWAKVM